jgi:hypothetical protein
MSTTPPTAVFECYVRTPDFEKHAVSLELSPALWDIFALTEERTSAADVVRRLGIDFAVAQLGLHELVHCRLLRKHVQRWQDYRAAKAPVPVAPAVVLPAPVSVLPPVVVPPMVVPRSSVTSPPAQEALTIAPAVLPAPVPRTALLPIAVAKPAKAIVPQEIRFSVGPAQGRRSPPDESRHLIRFSLRRASVATGTDAAALSPPLGTESGSWRLRPILDAIVRHGGGGVPGQLLTYRVFLRVPAELLDQAGLHSLNLTDDAFTIHNPELHAAILKSMREVAGLEVEGLGHVFEPTVSALP